MGRPDLPAAKRAGLPVDLHRLTAEGDGWLSDEERYALKTHGVCVQAQPGSFMIRIRTSGGTVPAYTARGVARLADRYGRGWVHCTTRQQLELHHVQAGDVTAVIAAIEQLGLTTSSTCGHTMRGVMSCPDAAVGLDEPFDCHPDARAVSDSILSLSPGLNHRLPQRVNIAFGGCGPCREHAPTNEVGFVSKVADDGRPGYELWLGGSLGRSLPSLGFKAYDFVPRADVLPAAHALVEVFVEHGEFDRPNRARLKHLIVDMGAEAFMDLYHPVFERLRGHGGWPEPHPVAVPDRAATADVLACAPPGGWSSGVRPQRTPGLAMVTVTAPLGDLDSDDVRGLCDLAEEHADGALHLTRNQNVTLRDVGVQALPALHGELAALRLAIDGSDQATDVRACTGGPVCSLALTPSTAVAARLIEHPALKRNTNLRVSVSGCMNACAQHQIADIGFSGSKVKVGGQTLLGYQVWVGGGPGVVGSVAGRVAHDDAPAILGAVVGVWEAVRHRGEPLSQTVERVGLDAFRSHIEAVFEGRWEPGPQPDELALSVHEPDDRSLPMVVA